jgi:hypothetical protein
VPRSLDKFPNPVLTVLNQQSADLEIDIDDSDNEVEDYTNVATPAYSWWRPANFPGRLSATATFAIIYDALVAIVSVFPEANKFLTKGLPAIVGGSLNIAPSFIPFLPNLFNLCMSFETPTEQALFKDGTAEKNMQLLTAIVKEVQDLPDEFKHELQKKLNVFNQTQTIILADRKEVLEAGNVSVYDNVVNTIYLITRAVGGILTIIKACNEESSETNEKIDVINNWLSIASNSAYIAYMLAHHIPKCRQKKKAARPVAEIIQSDINASLETETTNHSPSYSRSPRYCLFQPIDPNASLGSSSSSPSDRSLKTPFL